MRLFPWKRKKEKTREPIPVQPEPLHTRLSYQVANLQGIGCRERQEDSFAFVNALDVTMISEKGLFAIVADGMGGMRDGKVASETAVSSLKTDFMSLDYEQDLAEQLHESVIRAGEVVFQNLKGDGGSTAVVCMIYDEKLYYVSVGDSFLYLKRGDMLYRMNREHNVLHREYLQTIRQGSMNPEIAQNGREKNALTQFLGMESVEDADYLRRPFSIKSKDVLLLCSDGVGGVLTQDEILECLQKPSPAEMCGEIEQRILLANRPHQDNYTALVIQCGE